MSGLISIFLILGNALFFLFVMTYIDAPIVKELYSEAVCKANQKTV